MYFMSLEFEYLAIIEFICETNLGYESGDQGVFLWWKHQRPKMSERAPLSKIFCSSGPKVRLCPEELISLRKSLWCW